MPELPEVQTTVDGINSHAKGFRITDVWTDYNSAYHKSKDNIQDPPFFAFFKKSVVGSEITGASRRAKNVIIGLSNGKSILVHMKMTGHIMYGSYVKRRGGEKEIWTATENGPLKDDPFNRHIRLVFSLSDGKHLVLSDMRRFAKVTVIETARLNESKHLSEIGPEPLEESFDLRSFSARIMLRPNAPIKQVLMDHKVIAGIGNIYSDEILWKAGIHPLEKASNIPRSKLSLMFRAMKEVLRSGIDFGGDSMSDYRNILGESGKFQNRHNAYRKTGLKCAKKGCKGIMARLKVGGRSAHFCNVHQKLVAKKA